MASPPPLPFQVNLSNNYLVLPFFPAYIKQPGGCSGAVYLIPPNVNTNTINLYIRFLYTGNPNSLPAVGYSNADFQFALGAVRQGNVPPDVYVAITLLPNNMWNCALSARQQLMANFTDFLTQIESQFETNSSPILVAGATAIIAGQIAEMLPTPITTPQTGTQPPVLGESLFYRYGFNSGLTGASAPAINLTPGMRLRIEYADWQYQSPSSSYNSYISNGQFYYLINSVPGPNGQRYVAFDPYLGNIAAPAIPPNSGSPLLAGGIIDLASNASPRRYYKIVYPQNMIAATTQGDATTAKNIAFVGANSLSDLNSGGPSVVTTILRGRAIVIPEIPIWISNQGQTSMHYVPVGTTLANVLERFTAWKPLYFNQPVIRLQRLLTAQGTGQAGSTGNQQINYTGVTFPVPLNNVPIQPLQNFDIPVISGDNVTLNFNSLSSSAG